MNNLRTNLLTFTSSLLLLSGVQAQQVTIDFSEFTTNENSPVTSRGYEIYGWGSYAYGWGENIIGIQAANTNPYFSAEGAVDSCGGAGCEAEVEITFKREDGGPFSVHSIGGDYSALFRGKRASDGSWFSATPWGAGDWLNITEAHANSIQPPYGYGATVVYLEVDDIAVEEVLNIEIDLNPYGNNEIRPKDAYFFTIGVQTLSLADGDARDFDATTIDPAQVTAGPNAAPNVANPITTDYDGDGDLDKVFGFRMEATGITCVDPNDDIKLVATTVGGETVAGKDITVRVGCGDIVVLDFEELAAGTYPVHTKGYSVTGDVNLVGSTDKRVETDLCVVPYPGGEQGCWSWYASQYVEKLDGSPFALYDFDWGGFLGGCLGGPCGLTGTTTWGKEIRLSDAPLGTAGWLSLQSVVFEGNHFDTGGWYCDNCEFWTDDWVVADALAVEMDFDPWNEANEIRPKADYLITVQLTNTSIADGDAFDFDPATVDPDSLRLGPDGAEVAAVPLTHDRDGDGDIDRVFGFRMQDTGHPCTESSLLITGATFTGIAFASGDTVVPIECEEPMPVDVEPYSPNNRVYPDDDYQVQVAIINTKVADGDSYDFNPSDVSRYDLSFGPAQAEAIGNPVSTDVDGDGDTDRIFAFEMQDSGIACGDTEVELTSERSGWPGDVDIPLIGTDAIQTEDCETTGCHP
jgi:hypothetical protein